MHPSRSRTWRAASARQRSSCFSRLLRRRRMVASCFGLTYLREESGRDPNGLKFPVFVQGCGRVHGTAHAKRRGGQAGTRRSAFPAPNMRHSSGSQQVSGAGAGGCSRCGCGCRGGHRGRGLGRSPLLQGIEGVGCRVLPACRCVALLSHASRWHHGVGREVKRHHCPVLRHQPGISLVAQHLRRGLERGRRRGGLLLQGGGRQGAPLAVPSCHGACGAAGVSLLCRLSIGAWEGNEGARAGRAGSLKAGAPSAGLAKTRQQRVAVRRSGCPADNQLAFLEPCTARPAAMAHSWPTSSRMHLD